MLPFLALQARLGRKAPSDAILAEVPVIYVAFDVLAADRGAGGRALVEPSAAPRRRRLRLEGLDLPTGRRRRPLRPGHLIRVDSSTSSRRPSPRRRPGATRA